MARNKGTNVFALIGKQLYESAAGRIRWRSNMWALIGSRWDRRRRQNVFGEIVKGDHVLVKIASTHCPNPPGTDFWYDGERWWSVPRAECQKCAFHRMSGGGFRFPRCTFKRPTDNAGVVVEAAGSFAALTNRALAQAEQIVRGEIVDATNQKDRP